MLYDLDIPWIKIYPLSEEDNCILAPNASMVDIINTAAKIEEDGPGCKE